MGYYPETKVYHDGCYYVAIPKQEESFKKKRYTSRRVEKDTLMKDGKVITTDMENSVIKLPSGRVIEEVEFMGKRLVPVKKKIEGVKRVNRKEIFEKLYKENYVKNKVSLRKIILNEMRKYFNKERALRDFVDSNLNRKKRNMMVRRIRCHRKANLQKWNYFVTFTYDESKNSEEEFKKKLTNTLSHLSSRKGWKYIGVWEKSPEKNRLHFHGLFYVPKNNMMGEIITVRDYDTRNKRMRETQQNMYFNNKFGRSDFEEIQSDYAVNRSVEYILKYIEKTGEKIVYSRRLPTFIISDILDDDIILETGERESRKLILFDDFLCINTGEIIGKISIDVISSGRLRYAY